MSFLLGRVFQMVMVLAVLAIYQYINFHNSSEIDKFWYSLQGRGLLRFSLPPETAEVKWAWFTESLECHTLMAFHSHGTSHYIMFTVSPQKQQRHKVLTLHNETYKSNVMWHTRKSMQHIAQSTPVWKGVPISISNEFTDHSLPI